MVRGRELGLRLVPGDAVDTHHRVGPHRIRGLRVAPTGRIEAVDLQAVARTGEDHRIETHLIPNVLKVALGQKEYVSIFGTDYATPDGTCIRDYIHVCDLARAHVLALEHLRNGGNSTAVNLGTGRGFSVKEIITTAERRFPVRDELDRVSDGHPVLLQRGGHNVVVSSRASKAAVRRT